VEIEFEMTKLPGTHEIDLEAKTIKDISKNSV